MRRLPELGNNHVGDMACPCQFVRAAAGAGTQEDLLLGHRLRRPVAAGTPIGTDDVEVAP